MPLPAAKPQVVLRVPVASSGTLKCPSGGITSSVSPAFSASLAQVENTPPGLRLTAMRSAPSCTAEQIEYERRTSCAADVGAQRQVLALREAERLAQRLGHGERDRDGVARLGRRSHAAVNLLIGAQARWTTCALGGSEV